MDLSNYRNIEALLDSDIPEPILRIDFFLHAVITGTECELEPTTHAEELLYSLATGDESRLEFIEPRTILDTYLHALQNGDTSDLPKPRTTSEMLLYQAVTGEDLGVKPVSRMDKYLSLLQSAGGLDYILSTSTDVSIIPLPNSVSGTAMIGEMEGNSLVNCILPNQHEQLGYAGNFLWSDERHRTYYTNNIKPNTLYTVIVYNPDNRFYVGSSAEKHIVGQSHTTKTLVERINDPTETIIKTFTTPSDAIYLYVYTCNDGTFDAKVMLLEGDHTNNPPEYFEGISFVGTSKNNTIDVEIIDKQFNFELGSIASATGLDMTHDKRVRTGYMVVNSDVIYTDVGGFDRIVFCYDKDYKYLDRASGNWNTYTKHTLVKNTAYIRVIAKIDDDTVLKPEMFKDVKIYEKKINTTIKLPRELRSLPNGVCDRLIYKEARNICDPKYLYNTSISYEVLGTTSGGNRSTYCIPCKPNTSYYVRKTGGDRFTIACINKEITLPPNNVAIDNTLIKDNNIYESIVKTPKDAKYIVFYHSLNTKATDVMIAESDVAIPYEVFEPEGRGLYFEDNVGSFEPSKHIVNTSELIDGTLRATADITTQLNASGIYIKPNINNLVLCESIISNTHPTRITTPDLQNEPYLGIGLSSSTFSIREYGTTLEEVKNNLRAKNTIVYYEKENPTLTKISDVSFKCLDNATVYLDYGDAKPTKIVIRYPYKKPVARFRKL